MNIQEELRKFIAETQPSGQVSVLNPYRDTITELYVRGYTQGQIALFFSRLNINVSRESVGVFIRKHIADTKKSLREKVNSPLSITETAPVTEASEVPKPEIETASPSKSNFPRMQRAQKRQFHYDPTGESN